MRTQRIWKNIIRRKNIRSWDEILRNGICIWKFESQNISIRIKKFSISEAAVIVSVKLENTKYHWMWLTEYDKNIKIIEKSPFLLYLKVSKQFDLNFKPQYQ